MYKVENFKVFFLLFSGFPFSVYISLSYDFMKKEVMLIKGIVEIH